ncbi:hypothetical protein E8E12_006466 [Didymella heteroderae]|uniref:Uncharacterized protein n=1 Tax=Didymella heteroderae TaxID=1769908 RepID=A0A9P5C2A0_9PLEO|nr:hypothetical protein E8E12_006466 [Didymella heteroderae]
MAYSSPLQQHSQSQSQKPQSRHWNPQSAHFVPRHAWTASSSQSSSQEAPQQFSSTSTAQDTATTQQPSALRTHPCSGNIDSSRPPIASAISRILPTWANFKAHIKKDDEDMVAKAKEGLGRLGGEGFGPEFRETHKDRQGGTEITVREHSGGKEVWEEDQKEWEQGSDG